MTKLQKVLKKGITVICAAAMVAGICAGAALTQRSVYADMVNPGEETGFWAQFIIQNGSSGDWTWMNDDSSSAVVNFLYQTPQHYVMELNTEKYASTVDDVSQISIYIGYTGIYNQEPQLDVVLSNITLYCEGYDPVTVADYSSVAAGTNMIASSTTSIIYNIADQLPLETRTDMMHHIQRVEFDANVEYVNFADAPEATLPEEPQGEEIAQAYFIGQIGAEQNWSAGENAGAGVTPIYGDGTYEVTWNAASGGAALQFLSVCLFPTGAGVASFTTDTFPNLNITLNEVWIDGVQLTDYTVSENAVNMQYYDEEAGVTRIYLHDEWAGSKVADLAGDTAITQSVKAVFTISGTADMQGGEVDETKPEETTPEETEPEKTTPEETEPEETEPEKTTPEETKPEETKPEETTPEAANQPASSEDDDSNNTVKIVIAIVATVILLGGCIGVGIMFVKKNKQI